MPFATPDVESDVLAKLAELLPDDVVITGSDLNARAGPLRPAGQADIHEVYVQVFGGRRDTHSDGVIRVMALQVTVRSRQNDYTGGHLLAVAIHDALECVGPWVGASGASYIDTTASIAHPNHLGSDGDDQEVFAEAFDVVCETLRT